MRKNLSICRNRVWSGSRPFVDWRSGEVREPFQLLPEDVENLDTNHRGQWSKLREWYGKHGLLTAGLRIPAGFRQSSSDLIVLIPAGYPASPLDMF